VLEALERDDPFVVPLDDRRRRYRYHHLFADVPHTHLLDERPDDVAELHRRVSAWYDRNGVPSEAIDHVLAERGRRALAGPGTASSAAPVVVDDEEWRRLPGARYRAGQALLRSWAPTAPCPPWDRSTAPSGRERQAWASDRTPAVPVEPGEGPERRRAGARPSSLAGRHPGRSVHGSRISRGALSGLPYDDDLGRAMSVARLGARVLIGALMVGHGTQKLFGWFGGPGRAGTEGMMEALQMRPAKANALAAGVSETVGGTLLALGLATPLASTALTGVMTTAITKVHLANGPWAANGGWEYNAVLIGAVTALAEDPGDLSLDHALGIERTGPRWALGSLALGAGAAAAAMAAGRRGAPTLPVAAADSSAAVAAQGDTAGDPTTAGA